MTGELNLDSVNLIFRFYNFSVIFKFSDIIKASLTDVTLEK